MKALAAIVNSLLSVFIVMSGTSFIANKVADAKYLNVTAQTSGVYKGVSEAISRQLVEISARNLGISAEQVPPQVSSIVSEAYITEKSQDVTSQIEAVLRGEREKITIDISDLAAQARAAGLTVNATDLKPVEINTPQQQNGQGGVRIAQNLDLLRFISYLITGLLLAASIVLSVLRKRLLGLGLALLWSGLTFAGFAVIGRLVGSTVLEAVKLPQAAAEITPYAQTFARTIVNDINTFYSWLALILASLAVALLIADRFLKRRLPASSKPANQTVPSQDASYQAPIPENSKNSKIQ